MRAPVSISMEENIYSVTQLNDRIKGILDGDSVLKNVCVAGELSNYKFHSSGHHYFTLKDAESSLRCVMFRSAASKLRFRPEDGMKVLASGHVSVYLRDGSYQLYCDNLIPQGAGDLHVAYEQLKARLSAEGLFDPRHKKPIPRFPARIAVITSGTGDAVRDVIRITGARWPMAKIIVMPVRVQGAEAPPEIVGALNYANRHRVAELIITGRGGGSIEDLWAFNDERVARAIYASEIPVISAVGHEPDVTIADYVADRRASTPSNGAELAVPHQSEMRSLLSGAEIRAQQAMQKKLDVLRRQLTQLSERRVIQIPTGYIDQKRMDLDRAGDRLISAAAAQLAAARREQVRLAASLDALSPLKVLSRGYAVAVTGSGAALRSVKGVETGEELNLRLHDGDLRCLVEEKTERTGK